MSELWKREKKEPLLWKERNRQETGQREITDAKAVAWLLRGEFSSGFFSLFLQKEGVTYLACVKCVTYGRKETLGQRVIGKCLAC